MQFIYPNITEIVTCGHKLQFISWRH